MRGRARGSRALSLSSAAPARGLRQREEDRDDHASRGSDLVVRSHASLDGLCDRRSQCLGLDGLRRRKHGRRRRSESAADDQALNGPVLDRAAYVRAVLHRSRSIESARQAWRAAIARVRQSGAFDDPMVDARGGAAVDRLVERSLRLDRDGQPAAALARQALARGDGRQGGGRRRSDATTRPPGASSRSRRRSSTTTTSSRCGRSRSTRITSS